MTDLTRRFDAIVVGAGAAGGTAAASLAEAGLQVLVLDAGMSTTPVRLLTRKMARRAGEALVGPERMWSYRRSRQPVQAHCYAWQGAPEAFVDDLDNPYTTENGSPFIWIRSRQLGGRMVVPGHGRQYYRLGPWDLNPADGLSPSWPLSYEDLAPWYTTVEKRLLMAGGQEGLPWLPDGHLSRVLTPTEHEAATMQAIQRRWPGYRPALGRYSAPFGFLDHAVATGRTVVHQGAIVRSVHVDSSGRVQGVRWFDTNTGHLQRLDAPLVFLCASALESTRILLLSHSAEGQEGIGASSGVLGHNLMDHVLTTFEGTTRQPLAHQVESGRCVYLSRFDARAQGRVSPGRGFGAQVYFLQNPDQEHALVALSAFGEMLPRLQNRVQLHPTRTDRWGIPILNIHCTFGAHEEVIAEQQREALQELAGVLDVRVTRMDAVPRPPGTAIHECGTARMGSDPATSVLDPHNQCWEARGLYVTDGACLPSQGAQNPTLTYMALTARACAHAVSGRTLATATNGTA